MSERPAPAVPSTGGGGLSSAAGSSSSTSAADSSSGAGDGSTHMAAVGPLSLPKAGGAIRSISEKFSVNAANGTANLSIELPVSPGRNGFGPGLTLSYDSGNGNGPFGMGWSLGLPMISRRTDKGIPTYADDDESDIFVLAGAEDLVPELDDAGAPVSSVRTVHGVSFEVRPYRPRIEGLYIRIERWTDPTGLSHWRTISTDDVTTMFGYDEGSTICAADDPRKVFSYLISRRFDAKGNVITYSYAAEDGRGIAASTAHERNRGDAQRLRQRYLTSVRYGNMVPWFADWAPTGLEPPLPGTHGWHFEFVLDYGEHPQESPLPDDAGAMTVRPDPFSTYRPGFEVRTYRRVLRALMFHHFPAEPAVGANTLVRSLDFRYSDQAATPDPAAPVYTQLAVVIESGYSRHGPGYDVAGLPPLEFEYTRAVIDPAVHGLNQGSAANLPVGLDADYQWVDLDSVGLPGVLVQGPAGWFFKANHSPLTDQPATARLGPLERVDPLPSTHSAPAPVRLLDLEGSGSLSAAAFDGETPGYFRRLSGSGWAPFRTFSSLPSIDWHDKNLQLVDLTGDGRADVLMGEEDIWSFFPSSGEPGFERPRSARVPWDENDGARLVFADPDNSIQLADVSGDGLTDLVRVRDGDICYWPNLGYGRFGPKVTMDNAPRFAPAESFDPRRVRLADIDGSGTTDLIYLGAAAVQVCFNLSGNGWSRPTNLAVFPSADLLGSVAALDLLGNGTACLVWSSPLPGTPQPVKYIDLMSGAKPHLLSRVRNNLGAETRLHYAPSTRFYLQDRERGRPWATRLPFPVQVVDRVETFDWISRSRFVTRYAYHHGCYDGPEREFRGFGMVEEWDTEEYRGDTDFPVSENWDSASWSPPLRTKTWFHTGEFAAAEALSTAFAREYWSEPVPDGSSSGLPSALPPPQLDPQIEPAGLPEAHRALKGLMLRQESYADDDTAASGVPYTVTERSYAVRCVQPAAGNRHAVFVAHQSQNVTFHYDRAATDPRVTHEVTLEVDAYDQPVRTVAAAYPRRRIPPDPVSPDPVSPEPGAPDPVSPDPVPGPGPDFGSMLAFDQSRLLVMATSNFYTNATETADGHRIPQPCETITAELEGIYPGNDPQHRQLFTAAELDQAWQDLAGDATTAAYEQIPARNIDGTGAPPDHPSRRVIEQSRTLYRSNGLTGLLPLGTAESLALPGDHYRLAFTPAFLDRTLGTRVADADLDEGGYLRLTGHDGWWIPAEQVRYSPGDGDGPAAELASARAHFFRTRRTIDPFAVRRTDLDPYDLLPVKGREQHWNGQWR